ncbi:MAG TPA: hypothetical protein VJ728_03065 [Candidatus Binataceae bacterium]|nr:hypothetical protein [Candidatus Binataceae bacterium]
MGKKSNNDQGHDAAELAPNPARKSAEDDDTTLLELVRRGCLTRPQISAGTQVSRAPVAPLALLLKELDSDRGDR